MRIFGEDGAIALPGDAEGLDRRLSQAFFGAKNRNA
jgi:hypothetical protein